MARQADRTPSPRRKRLRWAASDCSEDLTIPALESKADLPGPGPTPTFIPERKAFRHPRRSRRGIAVLEAPGHPVALDGNGGNGEGELGATKRSTRRLRERPSKEEEREPDIESVLGRLPAGFAEDYFSSPPCARLERSGVLSVLMGKPPVQAAPRALSVSDILAERKARWLQRLRLGFSLLVEGLGSKRDLLETFTKQALVPWGADVACFDAYDARGSFLGFLRELLQAHPSLQGKGGCSVEGIAATIASARQLPATKQAPLVLVVHNLEALSVQHLGALASVVAAPGVRLVASLDHGFARATWTCDIIKDFNFVRVVENTLQGYEVELKGRYPEAPPHWCDPCADRQQENSKVSIGLVLRSLTNNHRELCQAMAKNQLTVGGKEGISTGDLLALAEDRMIASSITKLRSLLNELSDHEVVAQRAGADGGTLYWIPWRERILQKLADGETPDDADADDPEDEADEDDDDDDDGEESGVEED